MGTVAVAILTVDRMMSGEGWSQREKGGGGGKDVLVFGKESDMACPYDDQRSQDDDRRSQDDDQRSLTGT
jgi:hypothetical protein